MDVICLHMYSRCRRNLFNFCIFSLITFDLVNIYPESYYPGIFENYPNIRLKYDDHWFMHSSTANIEIFNYNLLSIYFQFIPIVRRMC